MEGTGIPVASSGAGKLGVTFIMIPSSLISRIMLLLITSLVSKGAEVRGFRDVLLFVYEQSVIQRCSESMLCYFSPVLTSCWVSEGRVFRVQHL